MKDITDKQIERINGHLAKMTESQQDAYIQKLEEAGLIQGIFSKIGSPSNNIKKMQKQKDAIIKQIDGMIKAINASKANGITPEQKQKDAQALTELKQKIANINMNIQFDETPVNVDTKENTK